MDDFDSDKDFLLYLANLLEWGPRMEPPIGSSGRQITFVGVELERAQRVAVQLRELAERL